MHLSAIGHTRIPPGTPYPPTEHPAGRAFAWERGRVLPALQLVAIRAGRGEVEWTRERHPVEAGTVFHLLPGEWHRYRPDGAVGWTEDWFELRGPMVDGWIAGGLVDRRCCAPEDGDGFFEAFDALHRSLVGGVHTASGELAGQAMALLARSQSQPSAGAERKSNADRRRLIASARESLAAGHGVGETASALGVSYPTLHRLFRAFTGISPKAYAAQQRLARAEALLVDGRYSVKEIAAQLGFHSSQHFSASFKEAYGISPGVFRSGDRGGRGGGVPEARL